MCPCGAVYVVKTGKRMKPQTNKRHYPTVTLSGDGVDARNMKLHRLAAFTFCVYTAHPDGCVLTVNHLDGNKRNYAADNLQICSLRENIQHARAMRLAYSANSRAVAVRDVNSDLIVALYDSVTAASDDSEVGPTTICERLKHRTVVDDCVWEYADELEDASPKFADENLRWVSRADNIRAAVARCIDEFVVDPLLGEGAARFVRH
jgi:hypothetical protein